MLEVGVSLPEWRLAAIDSEAMQALAAILRDPNPIHTDRSAVQAMGLGDRLINQGPANVGYVLNMLSQAFPNDTLRSFDVQFIASAFEGEAVCAGGVITDIGDASITCDAWLRADGRDVIHAKAVIEITAEKDP